MNVSSISGVTFDTEANLMEYQDFVGSARKICVGLKAQHGRRDSHVSNI